MSDTLIVEHCNMWIIKFIEIDYSISWLGMHKIVHVIGKLNSSKFVYPNRLFGTKMKFRFIFSVSLSHSPSPSPSPLSLSHSKNLSQSSHCLNWSAKVLLESTWSNINKNMHTMTQRWEEFVTSKETLFMVLRKTSCVKLLSKDSFYLHSF